VHAVVKHEEKNATITQHHQPKSHFQNEVTFKEWAQMFVAIATTRREDPTDVIVLLIDQAPQHVEDQELQNLFKEKNVVLIEVPKKMTHAFQPADMLIISNIRKHAQTAWHGYVQQLFATFETHEAVRQMYSSAMAICRTRKYAFLSEAIQKLSPAAIQRSWEQAGISKHVFGDTTEVVCVVDEMRAFATEAQQHIVNLDENDEEEEEDVVVVAAAPTPAAVAAVPKPPPKAPAPAPKPNPKQKKAEKPLPPGQQTLAQAMERAKAAKAQREAAATQVATQMLLEEDEGAPPVFPPSQWQSDAPEDDQDDAGLLVHE
jgi:hypothetical protein